MASVEIVQALQEQQVGDLLDDFERVRDAAGPEGIPDGVNLGADFACEQSCTTAVPSERTDLSSHRAVKFTSAVSKSMHPIVP